MTTETYLTALAATLRKSGYEARVANNHRRVWLSRGGRNLGTIIVQAHGFSYEGMAPSVRRDVLSARDIVLGS